MVKQQLLEDLKKAVESLGFPTTDIVLSIPSNTAFGDYSSNIALQQANQLKALSYQSPLEFANKILSNLSGLSYLKKVEVKGPGFLNFFIKDEVLVEDLEEILKIGENFGKNNLGKREKVQVEFISANPTGPLTLANGRGGALGDTLSNVLEYSGFKVDREYYVNDTGNQVRLLGESVLSTAGFLPSKDEYYKGEYIKDLAEKFKGELNPQEDPLELGHKLADYLLNEEIKPAIERLGVKFDDFYSERSVYEKNLIQKVVQILKDKKMAYESEGALWFKSIEFGDEKDRVLQTSAGSRGREEPTYFLADIAHHFDDLSKRYKKRINILGADHHGYGERIKGAVKALGFDDIVKIIFIQFVRLFREGKEVRMSKRAGTYVTLDELLEAVGKDVVRFFFLMYAPDSHIDFDLDLARERSNKNPVYYVQYAHTRMVNILKKAEGKTEKPVVTGSQALLGSLGVLTQPTELALIKHLSLLPEIIEGIAQDYQVQKLAFYTLKLADLFHHFYESSRVLEAQTEELKKARLALVKATKLVLGNTLKLMGIEAVERM